MIELPSFCATGLVVQPTREASGDHQLHKGEGGYCPPAYAAVSMAAGVSRIEFKRAMAAVDGHREPVGGGVAAHRRVQSSQVGVRATRSPRQGACALCPFHSPEGHIPTAMVKTRTRDKPGFGIVIAKALYVSVGRGRRCRRGGPLRGVHERLGTMIGAGGVVVGRAFAMLREAGVVVRGGSARFVSWTGKPLKRAAGEKS